MVNLLGRRGRPADSPRLDASSLARIEARLATLRALARRSRLAGVARQADGLALELEELDTTPTRLAVQGLLEAIDALRTEALAAVGSDAPVVASKASEALAGASGCVRDGGFVCHRPGRSLRTGEAEIASRGYFDGKDRPPLSTWLGLLEATSEGIDEQIWIVAWVEPGDVERARAGCGACPNGALAWLDEVSAVAAARLREVAAGGGSA